MLVRRWLGPALIFLFVAFATPLHAQTALSSPDGRKQVVAIEATTPIIIDGVFDEDVWTKATPATGFIQADPLEGRAGHGIDRRACRVRRQPPLHRRPCHDSNPKGISSTRSARISPAPIRTPLKSCSTRLPIAATASSSRPTPKAPGRHANRQRGPRRQRQLGRGLVGPRGAVPMAGRRSSAFPSRRFASKAGEGHVWGINFARRIRRKNEISYWSPVSRAFRSTGPHRKGTSTGLPGASSGPQPSHEAVYCRRRHAGRRRDEFGGEITGGLDVKAGLTPSLTLDVTVNPDFAQAEADEQQVNLTQFSLFFPEKREFFLENSGIFYFGDIPRNQRQAAARFRPPEEDLLLFFSRRIGLTDSRRAGPALRRCAPDRPGRRLQHWLHDDAERRGSGGRPAITTPWYGPVATSSATRTSARSLSHGSRPASSDDFNRVPGSTRTSASSRASASTASPHIRQSQADTPTRIPPRRRSAGKTAASACRRRCMKVGEGFRDDLGFVRRIGVTRSSSTAPVPANRVAARATASASSSRTRACGLLRPAWRPRHHEPPRRHPDHRGTTGRAFEYAFEPRDEAITTPFRDSAPTWSIPVGRYDWFSTSSCSSTITASRSRARSRHHGRLLERPRRITTQSSLLYRPDCHLMFDAGLQVSDIDLDTPAGGVRDDAGQPAHRLFIQHQHVPRCADAVSQRCEAVLGQRALQFDSPSAQRLLHRLQRAAVSPTQRAAGRGVVVKYTHMLAF